MELKKRILSAFILLTVLGTGMYVGIKENEAELAREKRAIDTRIEILKLLAEESMDIDSESLEFVSMALLDRLVHENEENTEGNYIDENEYNANAFLAYNEALRGNEFMLTGRDIAYLSSFRDNQSVVALNSTIGHYNKVNLDGDDTFVVMEGGNKPRVASRVLEDEYYYDILTGCYASDSLANETAISFGEFVKKHDLEPSGYCLPTFGKCEATEDALKTIEEIYGKGVADVIREKGLPVPFYSYNAIYDSPTYDNPVKGLTD